MSENSANFQPPEINPFQTPAAEAMTPEPVGDFVPPSPRLVTICMTTSIGLSLLVWFVRTNFSLPFAPDMWLWMGLSVILVGSITGLGFALLLQAVSRRQFAKLMPGHWRLIGMSTRGAGQAALLTWLLIQNVTSLSDPSGIQFWLMRGTEAVLTAAFFFVVLQTTQETRMWKTYAWICVIYNVILIPLAVLIPLVYIHEERGLLYPYYGAIIATNLLGLAAIVLFVIAVVGDYRQRIPRDGFHYVGLILPAIAEFAQWVLRLITGYL